VLRGITVNHRAVVLMRVMGSRRLRSRISNTRGRSCLSNQEGNVGLYSSTQRGSEVWRSIIMNYRATVLMRDVGSG
jgi:hypothetical protein